MGTGRYGRKKRANAKNKGFRKYVMATKHRSRDVDQIQDDIERIQKLKKEKMILRKKLVGGEEAVEKDDVTNEENDELGSAKMHFEYDPDLPGGGQFYCVETGRHFISAEALAAHKKTKGYKKRLKQLKEEKYTQDEANRGAGITKEKLPPAREWREKLMQD